MTRHRQLALKTSRILIAAIVSASAALLTPHASSQQVIKPEDAEVAIAGTIRLVHDFGPPGFGEDPKHDSHVSYWAIEVPVPVNTPCTPSKPEFEKDECGSAKRMKLFFTGLELTRLENLPAAKWKDQKVIVHGKLHRADTAGEMTPIYMDVTNITAPTGATTH
jgi:hypothetical protein